MRFGRFHHSQALGLRLAHTLRVEGHILRKGRVLSQADLALIRHAGVDAVVGAFLAQEEVDENTAAEMAGNFLVGPHMRCQPAAQGRCNLKATTAGVLIVDAASVNQANGVDAALTLATLQPFSAVRSGQVVATVKTIPFAVARKTLDTWKAIFSVSLPLRLAPFRRRSVGLLVTTSEAFGDKLFATTAAVIRARLTALGSELNCEMSCPHDIGSIGLALRQLRNSGAELILISGASVSKDVGDTVPAALVSVGGEVIHFGMPVDPGNMLLYGCLGGVPVINLPGCARSRRLNGFDWVLQRLLADLPLSSADMMGMGVGGLLTTTAEVGMKGEAEGRELENPVERRPVRVGALILVGGQTDRVGSTELLCPTNGEALLRSLSATALASRCVLTMVVSDHESEGIEQALQGLPVSFVYSVKGREGMSASLRSGLRALPQDLDGVVILLADMPHVTTAHIDRLIAEFDPEVPAIVAAARDGCKANPVIWPRCCFAKIMEAGLDEGAHHLSPPADAVLIEMNDEVHFADVGTEDNLRGIPA